MKPLVLDGRVFGRLSVVRRSPASSDGAVWWECACACACGEVKAIRGADLKRGFVQSCGCWRKEMPATRSTHGGTNTRLYRIWQAMRDRTGNPRASRYSYYGGRGIAVCAEWQEFEPFQQWSLANGYADNLSIDRIDVDGNYEPSNCRWATQLQQVRNRRPKQKFSNAKRTIA